MPLTRDTSKIQGYKTVKIKRQGKKNPRKLNPK